jgi:hypothetical protein
MAETAQRRSLRTQPIPRLQLGLLYVAAFGTGLVPYALLIRSWPVWLGLVLVTSIAFVVWGSSRKEHAGQVPGPLEVAPSMLGRCAASAMIGLFGIGVLYGFDWLRSGHASGSGVGSDFLAVIASAVFVGLLVIAIMSNDVRDTINTLYPDRPGQRSPYFPLAVQPAAARRLGLRILWILAAAGAVCVVGATEAFAWYFALAVLLFNLVMVIVGADYLEAKTVDSVYATPESAIEAVKVLLEAIGYRVIPRPRTGNDDADSVISILDFLAIRSDRAMAGRVMARADREDIDIRYEAASLEPAVWVLQDQLRQQQSFRIRINPVLLLLGSRGADATDDSSLSLSVGRSVKIIRTPSESELTRMIFSGDKNLLKQTAEALFDTTALSTSSAS